MREVTQDLVLGSGEKILWCGKPKKSAFIATRSLVFMPIAIIWLFIDMGLIISTFEENEMLWVMIPFMTLHLMPVWIWLGSMLSSFRCWRNANYYVTNKRIVIQSGFFAVKEASLFYKDLHNVQTDIGLINKLFNTGSIVFNGGVGVSAFNSDRYDQRPFSFQNLEEPNEIYGRIQKIILDIQTDIEYPNAFRPKENEGYNTDYNEKR